MKILAIDGLLAQCEAKGQMRNVNLLMLYGEELAPGDYLVVQKGRALEKIPEQQALEAWKVYEEMLEMEKNQV